MEWNFLGSEEEGKGVWAWYGKTSKRKNCIPTKAFNTEERFSITARSHWF